MKINNIKSGLVRYHHYILFWIIAGCLVIGGCAGLMNWHFKPRIDPSQGSITLPGLKEPVTIRRDAYGIPFIEAKTMKDMAMAMGYVNASDRLDQMIGMKLVSQGRLSEMAGPSVLGLDIYMRTLNLRRAAEGILKRLSPENRDLLESYCGGINAYLSGHKDTLPPGLSMAGYTPDAWEAIDSVMIFTLVTLSLSFNLHEEIAMLSIAKELGAEKIAWLSPIYPDEPIPLDEAAKLRGVDLALAAKSIAPLADLPALLKSAGISGQAASNNWAIGKDRTRGKASILCNDMHLFLSLPSMWNMMHIRCGRFDTAGMNLAGVPCIVAGYNGRIAWGMTMVMADNQDIFLEQMRSDGGKLQYLYKGQWLPALERNEVFQVKGEDPVTIQFHETVHGPLLNEALSREPVFDLQPKNIGLPYGIAMNWAFSAPDDDSFNAFLSLNAAGSVDEATPIIQKIRTIPLNMVFADKNSIAWQVIGTYPVRKKGRGLMPSPGWDGEYDWTGLLSAADLPRSKNPAAGFIGTANHRTVPGDYKHVLSSSWYWPERSERIAQMAAATDQHTDRTCMDMQLDVYSLFVPKLKAVMTGGALANEIGKEIGSWQYEGRRKKGGEALGILREFDGNMKTDSRAAAFVSAFLDCATRNIFLDEMDNPDSTVWKAFLTINNDSYNATCDHLLVRGDESPFWDDVRTQPKETRAQIMACSLADAVEFLESELGSDRAKWKWGALHTYNWETDTYKMSSSMGFAERTALGFMRSYFNRGPYPAPGDIFTLNVSGYMMGRDFDTWLIPSMRLVVDFSREEPMAVVNSSGQSDNPSSPHYDDGIRAWLAGDYIPFPFKDEAVSKQYRDVVILNPAGASVK